LDRSERLPGGVDRIPGAPQHADPFVEQARIVQCMKGTPLGRCGGVFEGCDAFAMEVVDLFQDSLLDLLRRERRNESANWSQRTFL